APRRWPRADASLTRRDSRPDGSRVYERDNVKILPTAFKTERARDWTRERLDAPSRQELVNLQANAERLDERELADLCATLLKERPRRGALSSAVVTRLKGRPKLIPRTRAFEARGVSLHDPRTSWSGVRKADGMVVMALWRAAVQARDGGCACLLWSPNVAGTRPWSDTPAGRERLEHCKLAIEREDAEGMLVYGQPLEGR